MDGWSVGESIREELAEEPRVVDERDRVVDEVHIYHSVGESQRKASGKRKEGTHRGQIPS